MSTDKPAHPGESPHPKPAPDIASAGESLSGTPGATSTGPAAPDDADVATGSAGSVPGPDTTGPTDADARARSIGPVLEHETTGSAGVIESRAIGIAAHDDADASGTRSAGSVLARETTGSAEATGPAAADDADASATRSAGSVPEHETAGVTDAVESTAAIGVAAAAADTGALAADQRIPSIPPGVAATATASAGGTVEGSVPPAGPIGNLAGAQGEWWRPDAGTMPPGAVGWGAPGLPGAAAPVAPQWLTTLGLNGGNLSAGAEPMRPIAHMPGLPVRPVPKSTRIPMAKGTLPAIAISGLAGAVLIPLDRPGIGWLLAGLATAGAVYAVDTTARRRADAPDASDAPDAPPTDPATRDDRPETGPDTATTGDRPKSGNEHAGPAIEAKPIAGQLFSTSISRDTDAANRSVETTPPNRPIDPATSPQARAEAHIDPPADSGTNDEPDAAGQIAAAPTAPAAPAEPVPASTRASTPPGITPPPPPASSTTATANPADARLDKPAGDTAWTRLFGTPGSQRSVTIGRVWWVALAIGLLAVGAVRAAEWLFVLCFLAAVVAASLAVVSRRSIYGFVYDVCAVPMQAIGSIPWVYRGMRAVRGRTGSSTQRVWWSLAATTVLLLIFVPLLAGADAVFARWVEDLLPSLAVDELVRWVFVFLVVALCAAGALYLLAGPPPAAADAPEGAYSTFFGVNNIRGQQTRRRFSRLEWGLPMGALTLLFALFLASRLAAMFGGDAYVMSNGGLTYAEYARTGFWQLSIVSMLTLAVIAIVQRTAAQESTADRLWLRLAVGAVSVLTLVIVASALHRMWVYQEAYGFTILRLLVEVLELWIGLVYLMVLASLVKLRRDWVPRAAIGAAAATLLTLAAINPELLIAERNVDRAAHGKRIDLYYLSDLSPDILPALDRLPDADRDRVEKAIRDRLHDDTWQGWNLSRSAARN